MAPGGWLAYGMDERVHALRQELAAAIVRSLGPMAQHAVSRSYGISQPRMSELNRGVVDRCTIDWLVHRIHRLGGSVMLTITVPDAGRAWTRARMAEMRERRRVQGG